MSKANIKTLYKKYPFIVAWGQILKSMPYYINQQVIDADADNAPKTAIYTKNFDGVRTWKVAENVTNVEAYQELEKRTGLTIKNEIWK